MKKIFSFFLLAALMTGCQSSSSNLDLAAEWFLNNQDEDFLHYEYDPEAKKYSENEHPLREMASLWAIAKAGTELKNSELTELAEKGFAYLEESFQEDDQWEYLYMRFGEGDVYLGYSAFAILGLLEMEHPDREELLEKFAKGILLHQNKDGSLDTIFYQNSERSEDYYPGEALLAMMELYNETEDSDYLDLVERAFPYYQDYFEKNPNTAFVPWQSQAYYEFYQAKPSDEVSTFIFDMADFMVEEHNPGQQCSAFDFSRGSVTAVYVEGMNKAYTLAKELEDERRMECYGNFVTEGLVAVEALLFREDNSFGLEDYEKAALGGIVSSEKDLKMRVDRNQHAVMAMLGAMEAGLYPVR